jgi:predicted transcriptional regulator
MRNNRMTILMSDHEKAEVESLATEMGVSNSEYVRLAVDNYSNVSAEQEAELAALVAEANEAIPQMRAALDRSCERLEATHKKVDAMLREAGFRK